MSARITGAVTVEASRLRLGTRRFWVAVRVLTPWRGGERVRVVLAIDRSSSMAGPRLEAAKRAARTMLELLRDGDELGLVLFDASVEVLQPVSQLDASVRADLHRRIDRVAAGRGTALAEVTALALELASEGVVAGEGHALLLTDGFPYTGETRSEQIVQIVEASARRATLTTVAFGDELDGPLLASMAEAGLGRFIHLDEHDDATAALGAELTSAMRAETGRVHMTVVMRDGRVAAHGGVAHDRQPANGVAVSAPPLVGGESAEWPFELETRSGLVAGPQEVGLVTVHATHLDGTPLILELPIRIEAGERLGEPEAEVVRARCLFHAGRALRAAAVSEGDASEIANDLVGEAGHIRGLAAGAGLEADPRLSAVVALLLESARDFTERGEAASVAMAAAALAVEQRYDPHVGSERSLLGSFRSASQRDGVDCTTRVHIDRDPRH